MLKKVFLAYISGIIRLLYLNTLYFTWSIYYSHTRYFFIFKEVYYLKKSVFLCKYQMSLYFNNACLIIEWYTKKTCDIIFLKRIELTHKKVMSLLIFLYKDDTWIHADSESQNNDLVACARDDFQFYRSKDAKTINKT